ncbi:hypothetical protein KC19_11G029500 [Ceratodon purpureus]|uniref:F-box domain-containing protein n=1 Tax=Ceratodon purpureus TaxID=3225 RepID=A0A8T0GBP7_CERPU|nr:hypothetical protein KC19_11G029500 [Ceratodon purpureus]
MMRSKDVEPGELEPRRWGSLPGEVLEAVFARMPTDAICRLRVLSRTWNKAASTNSTFTRLCAELQPSLYALLWEVYSEEPPWETARFACRFYDASACKWMHPFRLGDRMWIGSKDDVSMDLGTASDGGLVCFVNFQTSEEEDVELLPVLVCNPLTGEWRELPLHGEEVKNCKRVEMRVDRRTGDYEIILVAYGGLSYFEIDERGCCGEVYSSRTNDWRMLGLDSRRLLFPDVLNESSYVCDIAAGEFRPFDIRTVVSEEDLDQLWGYEAHWNNLYVTKKISSEFAKDWMRNGDGSLVQDNYPDEELLSRFTLSIYEEGTWGFGDGGSAQGGSRAPVVYNLIGIDQAVDGHEKRTSRWIFSRSLLMIICFPREDHQLMMIYDMEKGKWHKFDQTETTLSDDSIFNHPSCDPLACELRWDARP